PLPEAEFPVTTLWFRVSATIGVLGSPKFTFAIPPPKPSSVPSFGAVLPVTVVLLSVAESPWLRRPAPAPPGALLPAISLLLLMNVPPLAIPPPPPSDPPVAVLSSIRLLFRITMLAPASGFPLPLAMPPPPAAELPLTVLLFSVSVPAWFRIPPPPANAV